MNTKETYATSYIREVEKIIKAKRRTKAIVYSIIVGITAAGVTILLYKVPKVG